MFERFTDRARRVVVLSQQEARQVGHNYIGTEHLLLGLLAAKDAVAARVLESLGVRLEPVRAQVVEIIGWGEGAAQGHIPFTPRAKKVLELSLREAQQLGHKYIGTEHILLGLVREGEGVAAQVLVKQGCSLDRVREQVIRELAEHPQAFDVRSPADVVAAPLVRVETESAAAVAETEEDLQRRLSLALRRIDQVHEELRALRREVEEIGSKLFPQSGESAT